MACPYFDPEPVLFIDVDGVLSPVDPVFDDPGEWFAVRLGGARCWGSTVLGAWLHYLHDRGAVIVWATSLVEFPEALERYAAAIGAPPGLDTIAAQPHLAAAELDGAGTRWGVERWLNESKSEGFPEPDAFAAWFEKYQPEVIISKASFVLPLLKRMGLAVPRDVAFVDVFLDDLSGKTAGVKQNHTTVGALAVEILAGQLQHNKYGVPEIPTTTYVEGTWHNGASCPMPAPYRPTVAVASASLRKRGS